ncbi:MAG: translation initiation factor IF-2 N-terminal domain-containing protein, partial [Lachnospiraceae bacterium]|nr:translation initiation factor IF-2 N-terminal domain-containing protein [Lachnospiraceae bacterium]
MAKMRIYDFAKVIQRDNKEILACLEGLGVTDKTASSSIDDELMDKVRESMGIKETKEQKESSKEQPVEKAPTAKKQPKAEAEAKPKTEAEVKPKAAAETEAKSQETKPAPAKSEAKP